MRTVATLLLLGLLCGACGKNPERTKQEAFDHGQSYAAKHQFPQAIIEYRRALQIDAKFGAARKELAKAYLETGDVANALGESVRAADLLPEDIDAQIRAGNLLLATGHYDDARARAEAALSRSPDSADAHILKGNALAGLRDVDAALGEFEEAAAAAPENGLIQSNIGALKMSIGAQAEAEAAFRKATELSPDSPLTRIAYANFLLATKRPEPAEAELNKAFSAAPDDPTVRRAMVAFYLSTGRANEAEPHLRKLADISRDPQTRFALARYYFATERRDAAFHELETLASKQETYVAATLQIASAKYAEGQTAEGHKLLEEVLKRFPSDPRGSLVKAEFLTNEQKWTDAIAAAQSAVDRDPRLAEGFYLLGVAQQGKRDFEAAKQSFNEVLRLQPNATRAQVALANLSLLTHDSNTAQQLATAAAKQAPGSPDIRETLVRTMIANGDLNGAEKEISALEKDFPDWDASYILDGTLRYMRKDYTAAERAFTKAAALSPASVPAASGRVQVMLATGRGREARQFVDQFAGATNAQPDRLILAARTYATLRDYEPAERMLRAALKADPSRTESYSLLAQLYALQNRLDDALTEYQQLALQQPKSVIVHTMAGTILQVRNRRTEAKTAYQAALAIDSKAPVAANNLAWMMAEDGEDLDVALRLAQTAKAGLPDSAEAADTLGFVYLKKGLANQAVAEFRDAVAKQPDKPEFKYRLGFAFAQNGNLGDARRTLETALAQDPKSPQAGEARTVLGRLGRLGS